MPKSEWECDKCTFINVSQAKTCMICQSKYSPKACKHDYQHVSPVDEVWVTAPCMGCGHNPPPPVLEGEAEGGEVGDDGPAPVWVSLVRYDVVCEACRAAHSERTGDFLYLNRTDGTLYCTACSDSIVDADGTFWFVSSILSQRLRDDLDRNIVIDELVVDVPGDDGGAGGAAAASAGGGEGTKVTTEADVVGEAGAGGASAGDDEEVPDDAPIFMSGWTAMHEAAKAGDVKSVEKYVTESPEWIHGIHEADGWTPIFYAAYGGHADVVKVLIEAGSSVNYQCVRFGWSPLHAAIMNEALDVAELLIAAGSSTTARNNDNVTPIELCPDAAMGVSLRAFADSLKS